MLIYVLHADMKSVEDDAHSRPSTTIDYTSIVIVSMLFDEDRWMMVRKIKTSFSIQILGKIINNFSDSNIFPIYIIVIFNLDN